MRRLVARCRKRLGEIRPAPTPAAVDRGRAYRYALIAVGMLAGLAWINNSGHVAGAFLVALVLGLLWIAYAAHRALLTTALAIVWWIGTAPAVGVIATAGLPTVEMYFAVSQATATVVGLGVVVWLAALLIRAPRPATTVMACWALNLVVVVAASFVVPHQAWVAGYAVVVCGLAQRSGLLARLRPGQVQRGTPDPDDPEQLAVQEALCELTPGYVASYRVPLGEEGRGVAMLVGPTGSYAVSALVAQGDVRAVSGGTRLTVGGRRLDPDLHAAAVTAARASQSLHTSVRPVVLVAGGEFETGLVRTAVTLERGQPPVEVLVVRGDLAVGRLTHGHPVLTTGQVSRITRRIAGLVRTTVDSRAEVPPAEVSARADP